jgi:Skp family chaperone for outer membrane proteins
MRLRTAAPATLALLLGVLVLSACGAGRVAVVDSDRILNQSVRALAYQKQLDEREKAMALDLQLLSGRLSAADLEARRNQYLRELSQLKAELEEQLNKEVRDLVGQVVREKGLRGAVLVKGPVLFAVPGRTVDITEEVIARLR